MSQNTKLYMTREQADAFAVKFGGDRAALHRYFDYVERVYREGGDISELGARNMADPAPYPPPSETAQEHPQVYAAVMRAIAETVVACMGQHNAKLPTEAWCVDYAGILKRVRESLAYAFPLPVRDPQGEPEPWPVLDDDFEEEESDVDPPPDPTHPGQLAAWFAARLRLCFPMNAAMDDGHYFDGIGHRLASGVHSLVHSLLTAPGSDAQEPVARDEARRDIPDADGGL